MNDRETIIIILFILPLAFTAVWALLATGKPSDKPLFGLQNRPAAIGILMLLLIAGFITVSFAIYEVGDCRRGSVAGWATCTSIPDNFGEWTANIQIFGMAYLFFIGLPALICYVVAEIVTRIRMK